jgi:hypothetical protein
VRELQIESLEDVVRAANDKKIETLYGLEAKGKRVLVRRRARIRDVA